MPTAVDTMTYRFDMQRMNPSDMDDQQLTDALAYEVMGWHLMDRWDWAMISGERPSWGECWCSTGKGTEQPAACSAGMLIEDCGGRTGTIYTYTPVRGRSEWQPLENTDCRRQLGARCEELYPGDIIAPLTYGREHGIAVLTYHRKHRPPTPLEQHFIDRNKRWGEAFMKEFTRRMSMSKGARRREKKRAKQRAASIKNVLGPSGA